MSLTVLVGPTAEPVSLDEAKDHLRVTGDDDDAYISGLVIAARQTIEDDTRRALCTQTFQYTIDDAWPDYQPATIKHRGYDRSPRRRRIVLPMPPIQQVLSVGYFADAYSNGAQAVVAGPATLDPTAYTMRALSTGQYALDEAYGQTWPDLVNTQDAISVTYVAGYSASGVPLPEGLRIALLQIIGQWYEQRTPINPDLRGEPLEMPNSFSSLVQRYRILY